MPVPFAESLVDGGATGSSSGVLARFAARSTAWLGGSPRWTTGAGLLCVGPRFAGDLALVLLSGGVESLEEGLVRSSARVSVSTSSGACAGWEPAEAPRSEADPRSIDPDV